MHTAIIIENSNFHYSSDLLQVVVVVIDGGFRYGGAEVQESNPLVLLDEVRDPARVTQALVRLQN